jgi:hypothetical protein
LIDLEDGHGDGRILIPPPPCFFIGASLDTHSMRSEFTSSKFAPRADCSDRPLDLLGWSSACEIPVIGLALSPSPATIY